MLYVDFASDWPAYLFIVLFILFFLYIIIKGSSKEAPVYKDKKK